MAFVEVNYLSVSLIYSRMTYGDKVYKTFQYFFLTATVSVFPLGFYVESEFSEKNQQKIIQNAPDNSPSLDTLVEDKKD